MDWKFPCVYSFLSNNKKWTIHHMDDIFFWGLSHRIDGEDEDIFILEWDGCIIEGR